MARKKTRIDKAKDPKGRHGRRQTDPPADPPADELLEPIEDQEDDFKGLFDPAADNQTVIVELCRLTPENWIDGRGQTVPLKGFLENLPPGLESYNAYITHKYGGGVYQAKRKVGFRYDGSKRIDISGFPRVPVQVDQPGPAAQTVNAGVGETVEGLSLSGTDQEFQQKMDRFAQLKALAKAFDQQNDNSVDMLIEFNKTLMQIVLNQARPTNSLNQVREVAEIISAVKELAPGSDTGSTWPDILNRAISTVGQIAMNQRTGRPAMVEPGPAEDPDGGKEPMRLSMQDMAAAAVANIVQCYRLNKPVERVVTILDAALNLDGPTRAGIKAYRDVLFDSAELQVSEKMEEINPETLKHFKNYFDKVFDSFVDPERQPFTFRG